MRIKQLGSCTRVTVSAQEVSEFNRSWPCSRLRRRAHWFEFDAGGDLVDTSITEREDGPEGAALSCDAWEFVVAQST